MAGKHPSKALSNLKVNSLTQPGRYGDGNGLYLIVDPTGAKRWVLRIVVHGKRRDIGLGGLKLVSLADARAKALEYRKIAREGGNPIEVRRKATAVVPSFRDAAYRTLEQHRGGWRNEKHADQWINTLKTYAFPFFGEKRIDQIDTADVLRALSPIWQIKPETARRVRQRISLVMDWAKVAGYRAGDNPVDGVQKGLAKHKDQANHFSAIPYEDVPAFVIELRSASTNTFAKLAFELLILTACRTSEVIKAEWSEIDLEQSIWTIPAARMKAGRPHRIPLSTSASSIMKSARELSDGSALLFPGRSGNEPMSNMVFLMLLRRMNKQFTAHGFRSAFRDWAAEQTNFPRDVCEMALAHTIKDKTEAAYRRGDLFEKRRLLMEQWSSYLYQTKPVG